MVIPVVVSTKLLSNRYMRSRSIGPFVLIHPSCINDTGVLAYEIEHARQFCSSFGLYSLFYLCSKRYRLIAEMRANAKRLKAYGKTEHWDVMTESIVDNLYDRFNYGLSRNSIMIKFLNILSTIV